MDGILPLWKKRGMTSHDCVFQLRKILKTKKIGHTGTLDPDVDGVLPICVGAGTKLVELLMDSGKVYTGEITLGKSTTTEDASGDIVAEKRLTEPFSDEALDQAMALFQGEIEQIPPMYSAVKVDGKRLYEYARSGQEVVRPKRKVMIHEYKRTSQSRFDSERGVQSWDFEVACGKGTYVRTLAVDTGAALNMPAHMSRLTRMKSGGFLASQCVTLEEVAHYAEEGKISDILLPIEAAVSQFQQVRVTSQQWPLVKNGGFLSVDDFQDYDLMRPLALFYQNKLVSLYHVHPKKPRLLKPLKMIRSEI